MPDVNERVAEMLRRAARPIQMTQLTRSNTLADGSIEETITGLPQPVLPTPEQLVGRVTTDNRTRDLGLRGLEKARDGRALLTGEADILEAIILLELRPCIDILNGSFGQTPPEWQQLARFKPVIEKAIRGVGRIELPGSMNIPYGGTGFVVGTDLMLTNRHVAELFTSGVGQQQLIFRSDVGTAIDFRQEVGDSGDGQLLRVLKTVMIHPYWDVALLRVEGLRESQVLQLAANPPDPINGRTVVVVGYPMLDQRNDFAKQQEIFRKVFGKKRLLPGTLMGTREVRSFGKPVDALTHDSSTLGGNSGSLVLDLETGLVTGVHFAGRYMEANFAVPTWELANDNRLNGLNFDSRHRPSDFIPPTWLKTWDDLNESPGAGKPVSAHSSPTEPGRLSAVADWFERTTTDELASANQRDPAGTQALLRQTLLPEEADSLIVSLRVSEATIETFPPLEEGLFSPRVDPDLPEIVFLHGITGSHLTGGNGLISRLWLNPLAFVAGDLAEKLTLADDGLSDARPGSRLVADGHVRYVYERAARTWRQQGFVVHSFSFDWRKGIAHSADRLHLFLENLKLERPTGRPVVLVAHSMGSLVAALYAQRHPVWEERVAQAIFLGSPLRGSFAPVETVLGTYPFMTKLAQLCRNDDVLDLRRMAGSMPGLLDMMPDPAVFADAKAVYKQRFWTSHIVPQSAFLAQSLALKNHLSTSPLLKITTGIVSLKYGTVSSLLTTASQSPVGPATTVGDGTVPARSAVIPGRPNYKAQSEHARLPRDAAVIQAVSDLIRLGSCSLPPVTDADDLNAILPALTTESTDPIPLEAAAADLPDRLRSGIFTQADYDWLISR